jgi:hypothetical protein
MSKDRYERRHRRTAKNINCVAVMANANLGDETSLSEAMGLEAPTYTHVGYRREAGYVHSGRLYGHADYRGRGHALIGGENIYSGRCYRALCGKDVVADHDGYSFNISPATETNGAGVYCKRCLAIIKKKAAAS